MYLPLFGVLFCRALVKCLWVCVVCLFVNTSEWEPCGYCFSVPIESLHAFPVCFSEKDMKEGKDCGWWMVIVYQESVFLKEKEISDWQNLFCERNNAEQSSLAHEDKSIFKTFSHVCLNTFNGKRSNLPW